MIARLKPADPDTVEMSRHYAEADDPAGVYIHHHHDPVALEQNGLTAEEVDAPQAVLRLRNCGEPGWTITARRRSVIAYQNAPDDIPY